MKIDDRAQQHSLRSLSIRIHCVDFEPARAWTPRGAGTAARHDADVVLRAMLIVGHEDTSRARNQRVGIRSRNQTLVTGTLWVTRVKSGRWHPVEHLGD